MNVHCKKLLRTIKEYREPLILILVEQKETGKVAVYGRSYPLTTELKGFYRMKRILFQNNMESIGRKMAYLARLHRYNPNPSYEIHFEREIFDVMPESLDRYKPVSRANREKIIETLLRYKVSKEKIYRGE